jgi:hypothetical protein
VPYFDYWVVYVDSPGDSEMSAEQKILMVSSEAEYTDRGVRYAGTVGHDKSPLILGGKEKIISQAIHGFDKLKAMVSTSSFKGFPAEKQMGLMAQAVVHEVGHCLGLSHTRTRVHPHVTANTGSIMANVDPDNGPALAFSGPARAIFKRHYKVKPPPPETTLVKQEAKAGPPAKKKKK